MRAARGKLEDEGRRGKTKEERSGGKWGRAEPTSSTSIYNTTMTDEYLFKGAAFTPAGRRQRSAILQRHWVSRQRRQAAATL
jgi:hypothetical protein